MSGEDRAEERRLARQLAALNSQLFRENQQKDSERSRISTLKTDLVKARIDYESFLNKLYASHPELEFDRAQVLPFSIQDANGFWFDDNQDVAPCWPKAAEQSPEYSILDSQPRVRLFSLKYTQLLTEGKNLKGEVVARTEESAEAVEDEKWNHRTGFIE